MEQRRIYPCMYPYKEIMDLKKLESIEKSPKKRKKSEKNRVKIRKKWKKTEKTSEKSKIIDSKSKREQAYQTEDHVLNFIYYSLLSFIRM